jgi:hypothetical protein
MAQRSLMADQMPPSDGLPTWLIVALSVLTSIGGWKALAPIGRWFSRHIDARQQAQISERGDLITQLNAELRAAREENVHLRQELGEERELRMTFATDYAVTKAQVEMLARTITEDKKDCQRAIRALQQEVRELKRQIGAQS